MSISSRITSIEEHIGDIYDTLELGGFNPYKLPKEYTQVDYIQSSGTQYIDTGVYATENIGFEARIKMTKYVFEGGVFASSNSSSNNHFVLQTIDNGQLNLYITSNGNTYPRYTYQTNDTSNFHDISYNIDNLNKGFLDGEQLTQNNNRLTTVTGSTFTLFARKFVTSVSRYGYCQIKNFKIYDNNVLVRDYIPCYRNSDNEVGLYDLVNNVFYTNQGTGSFTYGAVNREKTTNKNIQNVSSALQQKYLDYMNNGTQEIWNNWEKVTGTGKQVTLNNTVNAPMDLTVKGDTSQVQYSGKNLFNKYGDFNYPTNVYIDATTLLENGTIQTTANVNLNASRGIRLNLEQNTDYIISGKLISSASTSSSKARVRVMGFVDNWTALSQNTLATTGNFSFTANSGQATDWFLSLNCVDGNNAIYDEIMIRKSTVTDATYEPYCGGTASPNPSYPQAIQNVTGDVEVLVQNKNILPTNVEDWEQGTLSNGINTSSTTRIRTVDYWRIDNDINYHVSIQNTNYCFLNISLYDKNNNYIGQYYDINLQINGTTDLTINIPSNRIANVYYMRVVIRKADNTSTITANEIDTIKPMIELNTTATTYTPHQEQTFTFPLGTQRMYAGDYLADDGIHHVRKQITFDGSEDENWSYYSNGGVTNRRFIISIADMKQGTNNQYPALSNRFIQKSSTEDNFIFITSSNKIVWFGSTELEDLDVAGFKTWLSTNNVIVEYELAEETVTPYTTEQQTVYNQIKQAKSYNEQTNISGSSDELEPIFEVVALKNI